MGTFRLLKRQLFSAVAVLVALITLSAPAATQATPIQDTWGSCDTVPPSTTTHLSLCISDIARQFHDSMGFAFRESGKPVAVACTMQPLDTKCIENFLTKPQAQIEAVYVAPTCAVDPQSNYCVESVSLKTPTGMQTLVHTRDWTRDPQSTNGTNRNPIPELEITKFGTDSVWAPAGWKSGQPEYLMNTFSYVYLVRDMANGGIRLHYLAPHVYLSKIVPNTVAGIGNTFEMGTQFANFTDEVPTATIRIPKSMAGWVSSSIESPTMSVTSGANYSTLTVSGKPSFIDSIHFMFDSQTPEFKQMLGVYPIYAGQRTTLFPSWSNMNNYLLEQANDKAAFGNSVWQFDIVQSTLPCSDKQQIAGLVTSNALFKSGALPTFANQTFKFQVANPHYEADGTVKLGYYKMMLGAKVAQCLYGLPKGFFFAQIEIKGDSESQIATQVVENGSEYLTAEAAGFHYSNKELNVKFLTSKPVSLSTSLAMPGKSATISIADQLKIKAIVQKSPTSTQVTCVGYFVKATEKALALNKATAACVVSAKLLTKAITSVSAVQVSKIPSAGTVKVSLGN